MNEIIRIPNISSYSQEIINNELVLTPIITYISESDFNLISLSNSKIISCCIKTKEIVISNKTKYRSILIDIWAQMLPTKILQNTVFNIKLTNENGKDGYNWSNSIRMSVQGKDATSTMNEIIKMIKLNDYSINICIKLECERIIYFKI